MLIETRRFVVRDFVASDWLDFLSYQTDPRYLNLYDFTQGIERVRELFELFDTWKVELPRENFQGGVFDRATGQLCGCAGIRQKDLPLKTAILGIELTPNQWGRYKLAIEVAAALVNFGFDELGLKVIVGDTSSGNSRVERMANWFGAQIINESEGPEWMQKRAWKKVDWAISRKSWEVSKVRHLLRVQTQSNT